MPLPMNVAARRPLQYAELGGGDRGSAGSDLYANVENRSCMVT